VAGGVKLVATAVTLLATPLGGTITLVGMLGAAILKWTGAGARAVGRLGEIFGFLRDDAARCVAGIREALASGKVGLAARILWLTLKLQWQRGTGSLKRIWLDLWDGLRAAYELVVHGLSRTWLDLWYGLQAIVEEVRHAIVGGWHKMVAAMKRAWAAFCKWHAEVTESLGNAIAKAWVNLKGLISGQSQEQVRFQLDYIDGRSADRFAKIKSETAAKLKAIEQEKQAALDANEQMYRDRQAKISEEHEAARKAAKEEHRNRMAAIGRQTGEKEKAIAAELAAAKEALQLALDAAAAKRAALEAGADLPGGGPSWLQRAMDWYRSLAAGGGVQARLTGAMRMRGTFSAAALQSLAGGDDTAERTARNTELTAKAAEATARILDKVKDVWGGVFG
jgi:hypothetical protein